MLLTKETKLVCRVYRVHRSKIKERMRNGILVYVMSIPGGLRYNMIHLYAEII